ncbi:General stress protein 26 [Loktanella fryxellensis]|uniref:General stress protein 26 n=1 Tax=Loktanella fryxellensis TaxID=245187 RepID=A0A1H8CS65_9RHOB|nr:pyridoxamine 5'-phosphate oxidase family protein [Loktanella fryxellensis]SEM97719.1 General stress protein 26 [Loktanella fryxellensis]
MTKDAKADFWDRVDDVQAGMLGVTSNTKLVPMSPNLRKDRDGKIWFIAAAGEDIVNAVSAGAQDARFVIADAKSGLYSNIEGSLAHVEDKAVLDEIWNAVASAWFEDDKDDADIRLLCLTPRNAPTWFTTTSGVKFFYEIAKANLTDAEPDTGYKADLTF